MDRRLLIAAVCAAATFTTSVALAQQSQPQLGDPNCAPNPWVTGGFCKRINAFNRFYCEWPCGTPPLQERQPADVGPFGLQFFDRNRNRDLDQVRDLGPPDAAPN